jgi:hypothetical protein
MYNGDIHVDTFRTAIDLFLALKSRFQIQWGRVNGCPDTPTKQSTVD